MSDPAPDPSPALELVAGRPGPNGVPILATYTVAVDVEGKLYVHLGNLPAEEAHSRLTRAAAMLGRMIDQQADRVALARKAKAAGAAPAPRIVKARGFRPRP